MSRNHLDVESIMYEIRNKARKKYESDNYTPDFIDANKGTDFNYVENRLKYLNQEYSGLGLRVEGRVGSIRQRGVIGENIPSYEGRSTVQRNIAVFVSKIVRKLARFITTEQRFAIDELVNIIIEQHEQNKIMQEKVDLITSYLYEDGKCDDYHYTDEMKYHLYEKMGLTISGREQSVYKLLEGKIFSEGKVVDLGCGKGHWMTFLQNKNIDVVGVDENPFFTEELVAQGLRCKTLDALSYLDYQRDESCSLITAFFLVDFLCVNDAIQLIHEIYRCLNINGVSILTIKNDDRISEGDIINKKVVDSTLISVIAEHCQFHNVWIEQDNEIKTIVLKK